MSIAGGHDRAVRAAMAVGFTALQVFTKSSNQWKAKPLTDEAIAAFKAALAESKIVGPIAHNSYLINPATPDDGLWKKSVDALTVELERAEALGIADLVIHPGAHTGSGEEAGLDRVGRALDEVHRRAPGYGCRIALETTAGQGTCLGDPLRRPPGHPRPRRRARAARRLRRHLPHLRGGLSDRHGGSVY